MVGGGGNIARGVKQYIVIFSRLNLASCTKKACGYG